MQYIISDKSSLIFYDEITAIRYRMGICKNWIRGRQTEKKTQKESGIIWKGTEFKTLYTITE